MKEFCGGLPVLIQSISTLLIPKYKLAENNAIFIATFIFQARKKLTFCNKVIQRK